MSRIGKAPIKIPTGITVTLDDQNITVQGPKGTLTQFTMPDIVVKQDGDQIVVTRLNDERVSRSKHGLMRTLVSNMIDGANQGFTKKLEIHGVGYRAALNGSDLKLNLGFSHDIIYKIPTDINVSVEQNVITISGHNKQQVGQVAAEIRAFKKPEPYKGKGIKYENERIIRKSGKSGKEK